MPRQGNVEFKQNALGLALEVVLSKVCVCLYRRMGVIFIYISMSVAQLHKHLYESTHSIFSPFIVSFADFTTRWQLKKCTACQQN